jgi:hypothetical protein
MLAVPGEVAMAVVVGDTATSMVTALAEMVPSLTVEMPSTCNHTGPQRLCVAGRELLDTGCVICFNGSRDHNRTCGEGNRYRTNVHIELRCEGALDHALKVLAQRRVGYERCVGHVHDREGKLHGGG